MAEAPDAGESAGETPGAPSSETDEGTTETPVDATALKNALAKERAARREAEKRAKALEPFERQAKDAEESAKSETQKLTEALSKAEADRARYETELARFRTAAEKGVPLNLVRFLTGSTPDEIAESAELLLKEIPSPRPAMPTRPKDRSAGGPPSDGDEDPQELIKQARAYRV